MDQKWINFIAAEANKTYYQTLMQFVDEAYATKQVYPPREKLYRALELCNYDDIKVVIVGQDPYHGENQADGLAFSCLNVKQPPSLKNIYKLLASENLLTNSNGDLSLWAQQGVLLLNRVLSVEANKADSHKNQGWEQFTLNIIKQLSSDHQHIVFVLWGNKAASLENEIAVRHTIIKCAHPSPLSAYRGFFDSQCFSRINEALSLHQQGTIVW